MTWTDERVQLLKEMVADGLSASQCADHLGVTRNAVCGKIDRLGLVSPRRKETTRPKKPKPWRSLNSILNARAKPRPAEPAPSREFLGLTFDQLEMGDGRCRYPRGEQAPYLFCGQPVITGSSYCATCHRRCNNPPTRELPEAEHLRRSQSAKRMRNGWLKAGTAA